MDSCGFLYWFCDNNEQIRHLNRHSIELETSAHGGRKNMVTITQSMTTSLTQSETSRHITDDVSYITPPVLFLTKNFDIIQASISLKSVGVVQCFNRC